MDDIFNFLNSTFEAGRSIINGSGKIVGYAFDGDSISGVFSLGDQEINYIIAPSDTPGDTNKYTLTLERNGQTLTHEHLYAKEVIRIFRIGESPVFGQLS